jgi:hypothetical protein
MRSALLIVWYLATAFQAAPPAASSAIVEARISPNGQSIAFVRQSADTGRTLGIYKIEFGGQSEELITTPDGVVTDLRWSSNGTRLSFSSRRTPDGRATTRVVPVAGGRSRASAPFSAPRRLRPSDTMVPIRDATVLFVTTANAGQQSVTLTNGKETWIELLRRDRSRVTVMPPGIAEIKAPPSWSADGKRFAVIGTPVGSGNVEIFAGSLPRPQPTGANMGAVPPAVRQVTGIPR